MDFSSSFFIGAANHLKEKGSMSFDFLVEGNCYNKGQAEVEPIRRKNRVSTGDACKLPDDLEPLI